MRLTRWANLEDFEEWFEDVAERNKSGAINNGGLKLHDSIRYFVIILNHYDNYKKNPILLHTQDDVVL